MITLNCAHADTCLSDYWSGHHAAHIQIPVSRGMSFAAIREALHAEINAGAFAGNDPRAQDNSAQNDDFIRACHAAINRDVKPAKKGARRAFLDLEATPEDFDGPEVYAFFVFTDRDDSRAFFLREGSDELEKARPFPSMRAAVDAFARSARELARFGQHHDASVHIVTGEEEPGEYPDFVLSLTARGAVKVDAA